MQFLNIFENFNITSTYISKTYELTKSESENNETKSPVNGCRLIMTRYLIPKV